MSIKLVNRLKHYPRLRQAILRIACASYFKTITLYWLGKRTDIDLYVNPSPADIKALKDQDPTVTFIRYIADATDQKLYVWSGSSVIHEPVAKQLGFPGGLNLYQQYLCGSAPIRGYRLGKPFSYGPTGSINEPKWEWVKSYFTEEE